MEAEDAAVHVRLPQLDAEAPHFVHQRDDLVDGLHVRREHRGHELRRVVRLQPAGLEGEHGVAGGVGFGKGVAGELLHLIEDLAGDAAIHAGAVRAVEEHGAHRHHLLRLLLGHRAAQQVRLAEGEAGEPLRHVHHLLLVEHHAVGALEGRFEGGVRIVHAGAAVLAGDVVVHGAGLQGAGAEQGDQGD